MSNENGVLAVVDGITPTTATEKFNQLVRAIVVLALVAGFIYGFVVSKVVSTESFAIVLGMAITWWFKNEDEKKKADVKTTPTPGGSTA